MRDALGYNAVSERRACRVLGQVRSNQRRARGSPDDEPRLLDALFGGDSTVKMSELRGEFHEDLAKVKEELYKQGINANRFFPRDPEKVRSQYQLSGLGVVAVGGIAIGILGAALGVGLIGVPIMIGGVVLFLSASTMPRRTARGRQMYRRCLGFRTYMTAGDQDRQRFAEEANIFEEYLPYAIVFKSARKWAAAFEALGIQKTDVDWYVSPRGLVPLQFATSVCAFSSSVSTVMASTPGGSGASGIMAERVGAPPVVAVSAGLFVASALLVFLTIPAFRSLDREIAAGQERMEDQDG